MTEDSDPDHLDPAGKVADLVESGDVEIELADDQDVDELRDFIETVEATDEMTDPGTNAMVRIARTMLDSNDE
jgi:hypothetical protein